MRYQVTYKDQTDASGQPLTAPAGRAEVEFPDGIVLDKAFIERTPPDALHSEETLEEDDDFLSLGFEVWEYEIADGRQDEFVNALSNSQMVIDYQTLDEEPTPAAKGDVI